MNSRLRRPTPSSKNYLTTSSHQLALIQNVPDFVSIRACHAEALAKAGEFVVSSDQPVTRISTSKCGSACETLPKRL